MEAPSVLPVIDFTSYVADKTREFTGREWVFTAINGWLADLHGPHAFLLTGKPGSGKTAVVARLAQFADGTSLPPTECDHLTRGFLSAAHFCSARDRRWISPHVFAQSLALQLADRYPVYAKALAEMSGDRQIRIDVGLRAREVSGQMIGVVITHLDVSGVSPEDAFIRVVREPLKKLADSGFEDRIVILVDALDEALGYSGEVGIIELLAQAQFLPAGVRFILTSRPESKVLRTLQRLGATECSLTTGVGRARSLDDVREYLGRVLSSRPALVDKLAVDLPPETFATAVDAKSEGNFLYVTYLLEMLASQSQITRRDLDALPVGLDGIYVEFLDRRVGRDVWPQQYAPVLGPLAVAQEALGEDQLTSFAGLPPSQVRQVRTALRSFLDVDDALPASQRRYTLYHRSFAEFLLDGDCAEEYWCPAIEQHQRIIEHYRAGAISGETLNWSRLDTYGLNNLAMHLFESGNTEGLHVLISENWMRARYQRGRYTYTGFLADVNLAWQAEVARPELTASVVSLARLQTARQVVDELVSAYDDVDLETLVWLGRADEALAHARLRPEAGARFHSLLTIWRILKRIDRPDRSVLDEAVEVSRSIRNDDERVVASSVLAVALIEAGDSRVTEVVEEVRRVASAIQHPSETMSTSMYELAIALVQAQHSDTAWDVALAVRPAKLQVAALCCLGAALAQVGDSRADAVFDEAREVANALVSEWEQMDALHTLAEALAHAGRIDQAWKVADDIQDHGRQVAALLTLAATLAKARVGQATALFDLAEQAARALAYEQQVEPLSDLAVILAQAGNSRADRLFHEAEQIARAIPDKLEQQPMAFDALAERLARVGRFQNALAVARALANDAHKSIVLRDVALALAQAEDDQADDVFDDAEAAARAIPDRVGQAEALRDVVVALARVGRYNQAEEMAQSIEDDRLQMEALRRLGADMARAGNQRASEVFDKARDKAHLVEDAKPISWTLSVLVGALVETGHLVEAEAVARLIWWQAERAAALLGVAVALAQSGDRHADALFDEVEGIAARETPADHNILRWLAVTLAQAGRDARAREIADSLRGWKLTTALDAWVAAHAQAGRFASADEDGNAARVGYSEGTDDAGSLVTALRHLAVALAKAGHPDADDAISDAKHAASSFGEELDWVESLCTLAAALVQVRDDHARAIYNEAVAIVEAATRTTQNRLWKIKMLCTVAAALVQVGDDRWRAIFNEAEAIARMLHDNREQVEARGELATVLAHAGRFGDALLTLGQCPLHGFLRTLAAWASAFETSTPGLSIAVLRAATNVAGWVRFDWRKVHQLLPTPESAVNTTTGH
jgi:hypothetical protein